MVTLLTTGDPDESAQSAARQLMGRYTLEEAVQALAKNVKDIDVKVMLKDLKAKVLDGTVKAYAPAQVDISHTPVTVRSYYEEVEWDVLNKKWLTHFDAIGWRYPNPLDKLRPDWSYWNLDHLPLEDAISLSIDVTPEWTLFTKELGRKNVLHIQYLLVPRLKNALNWAESQNCTWIYDSVAHINSKSLIKLRPFISWIAVEQPDWTIPKPFQAMGIKDSSVVPHEGSLLSRDAWQIKARDYALHSMKETPKLTLNEVCKLVHERFEQEQIKTSHGGGKALAEGSIKDALSGQGWFSRQKRLLNSK